MNFKVGDTVFVRANTRDDYVGRIAEVDGPFTVTLDQCSWIANSGRFHEFMQTGRAINMEIEPMGDGFTINWSLIGRWSHNLFMEAV